MKNQFAGTWMLVRSTFQTANGEVTYPLGENAEGRIIYDAEGNMAAQLMRPQRATFLSTDSEIERGEKIAAAYHGYTAYYGRYTIQYEQGIILHHVQASLNPNWIGADQIRYFTFSPDQQQLTLRTPPLGRDGMMGELIWQKLS